MNNFPKIWKKCFESLFDVRKIWKDEFTFSRHDDAKQISSVCGYIDGHYNLNM
jgi:hypothetical protein